jgi:hypothetical protein
MATIEGEVVIGRPVHVVFDYVADERDEPQYNPRMVRAEKVTDGPVGQGMVFHSAVAAMGRTVGMRIECTAYQRPTRFASTRSMRQADFTVTLTFEPVPAGWVAAGLARAAAPWAQGGLLVEAGCGVLFVRDLTMTATGHLAKLRLLPGACCSLKWRCPG